MKLLVVDSDRNMVEMLTAWLKVLGYQVSRAYTGEQAKAKWIEHEPDLVILDSALPDTDALVMCRDLRSKHDALVLVITLEKDIYDEVRCLESGVDDYLRKPFLPDQLLARIRSLERRARSTAKLPPSSRLNIGPICFDPLRNTVIVRGKSTHLTPTEGKLLTLLAVNANDVCTAEQIVTHVWGFGDTGDEVLIKTHIYNLRRKIEPDPAKPRYILTVPGIGYTLVRRPDKGNASDFDDTAPSSLVAWG